MLLELITRQRPTGEMFTDGLDLRKWLGAAAPHHIFGCGRHVIEARGTFKWCYKEAKAMLCSCGRCRNIDVHRRESTKLSFHIFDLPRAPKPLETDGIWEMKHG
jgi:hypothetical protein